MDDEDRNDPGVAGPGDVTADGPRTERRAQGDRRATPTAPQAPLSTELRWTVGCLVATLSMVGILILVGLVAIALSPPTWVQVVLGAGLAIGGAIFAWLIATALGQRRGH